MNLTQNQIEVLERGEAIEIEKEWVDVKFGGFIESGKFDKGKKIRIPKYKVEDDIYYCLVCNKEVNEYHKEKSGDVIKLKIISETETHWKVRMG